MSQVLATFHDRDFKVKTFLLALLIELMIKKKIVIVVQMQQQQQSNRKLWSQSNATAVHINLCKDIASCLVRSYRQANLMCLEYQS